MQLLKNFKLYTPQEPPFPSTLYLRDENGDDWYELQKTFGEETLKVVFNSENKILASSTDASTLWPVGLSVAEVETSSIPEAFGTQGEWAFDGKKITARVYTKEELVTQATAKRDSLMAIATTTIAPLQDAVDVGDATEDEVALLTVWKKYRVALNRLELSTAPEIEWPSQPR